jgi:hypothetical protein
LARLSGSDGRWLSATGDSIAAFFLHRNDRPVYTTAKPPRSRTRDHDRSSPAGSSCRMACGLGRAAAREGARIRGPRAILDRLASDYRARTRSTSSAVSSHALLELDSRSATSTSSETGQRHARTGTGGSRLLFPSPVQDGRLIVELRKQLNVVAERAGWMAEEVRTKAFRHRTASRAMASQGARSRNQNRGTRACGPVAETSIAGWSAPSAAPRWQRSGSRRCTCYVA